MKKNLHLLFALFNHEKVKWVCTILLAAFACGFQQSVAQNYVIGGVSYHLCCPSETVTAPFLSAAGSATINQYSGYVLITVSGTGHARGGSTNDAFYFDIGGNRAHDQDRWQLVTTAGNTVNNTADNAYKHIVYDVDAGAAVTPPYTPAFRVDNTYTFIVDINTLISTPGGATILRFGVDDTSYDDNSGEYTVEVTQLCSGSGDVQPAFYQDADNDNYGNPAVIKHACSQPPGFVTDNTDCNDNDASVHSPQQYYVDADGDGYDNGTAMLCSSAAPSGYSSTTLGSDCNDNDASVHSPQQYYIDADGDGYDNGTAMLCSSAAPSGYSSTTLGSDCNDNDASVHSPQQYYIDADGDGYDNGTATFCSSAAPSGYSSTTLGSDCNDNDAGVHSSQTYFRDYDGDGYGDLFKPIWVCSSTPPSGYVKSFTDCNDHDKNIHTSQTYYKDYDKDGYGDPDKTICVCSSTPPDGYVKDHTDCNDRDKTVHSLQTYFRDYDKDGYGDADKTTCVCSSKPPSGYVKDHTDCNDHDKNIHSSQTYYKDYDKDGYGDADHSISVCLSTPPDGYVKNHTDCNDHNKNVHPGAKEIAGNHIDDNCNGKVDEKTSAAKGGNEEVADNESEDLLNENVLKVNVLPNPSSNYFTLNIKGNNDKPVELRIVDIAGRLLEVKNNIPANSSITIGHNYNPGVYLAEVVQGGERVVIKCIKQ